MTVEGESVPELMIVITSPPERDDFVAEIWDEDQGVYVGAVERRDDGLVFTYVAGDKRLHHVDFSRFLDALQRAKDNL